MTELLSPAGDMECFRAALYAGADAIYVGGKKYGARAYAGNFESEDLLAALKLAHLHHKKVYLTVNTLMKEHEAESLIPFLRPLYEEGLDGVIVQDVGGLMCIRDTFPGLELHASTQMTVTGAKGASLLKEYGISRIVPARELSLAEITRIKECTGLELETFIHGAMCYGYSGQCLFSSMMGERSGNRGRCAGPCRLPYDTFYNGERLNSEREKYPLSLKDLCTLEILPQLINAEIDSFKIEGRMKTPSYVSFVTGMYRKYMDLYLNNPDNYKVSKEDLQKMRTRFCRGDMQSGYYFIHNGRELVTLDKPGYTDSNNENVAANDLHIDLIGHFEAKKGKPIRFTAQLSSDSTQTISVEGTEAVAAQNCPASYEDVKKQLSKTGNTEFSFSYIDIEMDRDLFLSKKELNELRRDLLIKTEEAILAPYRRVFNETFIKDEKRQKCKRTSLQQTARYMNIEVRTLEQLKAIQIVPALCSIYLTWDVVQQKDHADALKTECQRFREAGISVFIKFSPVCRETTVKMIMQYRNLIEELSPDGFCVGNLECLTLIKEMFPNALIIGDSGMYFFNPESASFYFREGVKKHILSYELHQKEITELLSSSKTEFHDFILPVYGYIPVMESAGCLLKTFGRCRAGKGNEQLVLTDRYKKKRIVITHCDRCENTIYNAVPLSLHKETESIKKMGLNGVLLRFTIENAKETKQIQSYFCDLYQKKEGKLPISEFTKGHFLKGVE